MLVYRIRRIKQVMTLLSPLCQANTVPQLQLKLSVDNNVEILEKVEIQKFKKKTTITCKKSGRVNSSNVFYMLIKIVCFSTHGFRMSPTKINKKRKKGKNFTLRNQRIPLNLNRTIKLNS